MQSCVVLFPGSNAEVEMARALAAATGAEPPLVWHKDRELPGGVELVAIPGGFSYGDYLRPGAIARASPIVPALRRYAERGGLVLGVCNGFQVLTEIGLVPGALVRNEHLRFECRDIHLTVTARGAFTPDLGRVLRLPIAHAEGRYTADAATLLQLEADERIAFRYCDAAGGVVPSANPNGSVASIAGVYGGPDKNVLGLMPHPERAAESFVGSRDGRTLFDAVVRWHAARRLRAG